MFLIYKFSIPIEFTKTDWSYEGNEQQKIHFNQNSIINKFLDHCFLYTILFSL